MKIMGLAVNRSTYKTLDKCTASNAEWRRMSPNHPIQGAPTVLLQHRFDKNNKPTGFCVHERRPYRSDYVATSTDCYDNRPVAQENFKIFCENFFPWQGPMKQRQVLAGHRL